MASLQSSWLSSFSTISHSNTKKAHTFKPFRVNFSVSSSNEESPPNSQDTATKTVPIDPVKLAFERAKEYKKSLQLKPKSEIEQNPVEDSGGKTKKESDSIKVAVENTQKYGNNKGNLERDKISGLDVKVPGISESGTLEKKEKKKKEGLSVSSIDFVGLKFADKKTGRALPAGLVPRSDPFFEGDFPEVEIIVGNTNDFTRNKPKNPEQTQENESEDVYKPKVSTWGVFPRPSNISKTFGGGKTLKPGEALESAEERAAKNARTRELIAAYKRKNEINIDPKTKAECEEALKNGDSLMDRGKLGEALPFYQKIMSDIPFKSELHGLAALQWSICQDSLRRTNEARVMYEKLQSHPNAQVSKKARQFVFSFQAMEMMKVTESNPEYLKNIGYQDYFEAFVEKKTNFSKNEFDQDEDGLLSKTLPYILLLVSPIFLVLLAAVKRRI